MNQPFERFCLRAPCGSGAVSYITEHIDASAMERICYLKGARGALTADLLCILKRLLRQAGVPTVTVVSARRQNRAEGLILPERKTALIDAAYPDAPEPEYPCAGEFTVNVDPLTDRDVLLASAGALRMADAALKKEEARLGRYLSAIRSLYEDSAAALSSELRRDKLERYAAGFAAREFPRADRTARARHLLSATLFDREAPFAAAGPQTRYIAVDDAYGPTADAVFDALAAQAVSRGLDCVFCRDPLLPDARTDLLLVPAAGIAFFRAGAACFRALAAERTVHTARFLDGRTASAHRNRLTFNKKAIRELAGGALDAAEKVGELQDVADQFYLSAADPGRMREFAEALAKQIL